MCHMKTFFHDIVIVHYKHVYDVECVLTQKYIFLRDYKGINALRDYKGINRFFFLSDYKGIYGLFCYK